MAITNKAELMIEQTRQLVEVVADKINVEAMGIHDNSYEFITCVNSCLVHFTQLQTWRHKYYDTDISNIFTVTDEALAILLW